MEMSTFDVLYKAMESVRTQRNIDACYNLDYSNAKKGARDKFMRKMYSTAFPWQNEETVNADTIARMFGSGGQ